MNLHMQEYKGTSSHHHTQFLSTNASSAILPLFAGVFRILLCAWTSPHLGAAVLTGRQKPGQGELLLDAGISFSRTSVQYIYTALLLTTSSNPMTECSVRFCIQKLHANCIAWKLFLNWHCNNRVIKRAFFIKQLNLSWHDCTCDVVMVRQEWISSSRIVMGNKDGHALDSHQQYQLEGFQT